MLGLPLGTSTTSEIAAIEVPSSVSSCTDPTTGSSVASGSEDSDDSDDSGSSDSVVDSSGSPSAGASPSADSSDESERPVFAASKAPSCGASGPAEAFCAVEPLSARSSPGTLISPRFDAVVVDSEEARAPISSRPSALMSVRGDELISGLTGTAIAAVELESPNVVTMTAAAHAATEGTRILIVSAFVRKSGKEASTKWGRRWMRRTTSTSQDCYIFSACLS